MGSYLAMQGIRCVMMAMIMAWSSRPYPRTHVPQASNLIHESPMVRSVAATMDRLMGLAGRERGCSDSIASS